MLKKRLLTLSMTLVMMTSIGLGTIDQGVAYAKSTTQQDTKAELEKVIKIVKQRVTIPEQCTEFEYYINSDYSGNQYVLYWSDTSYNFSVNAIADVNGNIINYSYNDYSNNDGSKVNYLKSELEETALKAVEKVNPCMKGHLKLTSSSYTGKYSNAYEYTFTRIENGIESDDYACVTISADTKNMESFYANWLFNVIIPSGKPTISKEQAQEIAKKNMTMELKYLDKYSYVNDKYEKSVYLAYVPSENYISVDAQTGEVYLTQYEFNTIERGATESAKCEDTASTANGVELTQKEMDALNVLDDLIDKDAAVKIITENDNLLIDKSAISISTHLVNYNDQYYWRIYLSDPTPVDYENVSDYYRAYANAVVNAKTGKIVSFNASTNENEKYSEKSLKTVAACRKRLLGFTKTQDVTMVKNAKYDQQVLTDNDSRRVNFTYDRVNEGVIYEGNYFSGSVDRVTGKVCNYYYQWDKDLQFESPKNVMSADKALDCYLELPGFCLAYEDNAIHTYNKAYQTSDEYYYDEEAYSLTHEIRLVYNTTRIEYRCISPFNGKEMEDGKVVEPKTVNNSYTDVKGHQYERSILLLSDIGLGYKKDEFEPDSLITKEDFIKFFEAANLYSNDTGRSLLKDDNITRQQAAQFIIECTGLSKIANLKGIYKTDYIDESSIATDALGAVALCKGLNLVQFGSGFIFGPSEKLTRGEAAKLVMDLFSLSESNLY